MTSEPAVAAAAEGFGVRFAPKAIEVQRRADGSILLQSPIALTGCADNIVDYLQRWAQDAPERLFLAQRAEGGGWETMNFGEAWRRVQAVAQVLLDLGAERRPAGRHPFRRID